jgi:MFS family permease
MTTPRLGLKENRKQFVLLVIINAFVGGMVGMERTILPQIAAEEFHIAAKTAIFSFIIVFGLIKAVANYCSGILANKIGRKNLLIIGWIIGVPVPLLLMYAPGWNWIIAANVLLGINQGLTWSGTVMMKIDLVGEKQRGLAMGLNEFAGYIAVALVAFVTGWVAGNYGLRPYPFYIGIVLVAAGLILSWLFVKDTRHHVAQESVVSTVPRLKNIFQETTWKHKNLGSVTQAGLVNNLNDGMVWGLLPMLLLTKGFSLAQTGIIVAIYPAVWGIGQLFTGRLADKVCNKDLLFIGMVIQGIVLIAFIFAGSFFAFAFLSFLLGWGTAMVYPVFLTAISEQTHPLDRAESIGIFRFWRDSGYAIGAVLTGLIADALGINCAVFLIGILTLFSAWIILKRMQCNKDLQKVRGYLSNRFSIRPFLVSGKNRTDSQKYISLQTKNFNAAAAL